ncbi:CLAVATA3/ESR (CLE)-related protein 12-like [Magnolia sinica]|uniref:CLAVATA3/ESR (CLE)-related protein 12-like n=1 Tax=Magnolia sinica TaxID=86752 RepID=UPI00265B0EC3|nr:CLAVATA3/ESR (CLE)-related protein 12-like [Magnolia sinica]
MRISHLIGFLLWVSLLFFLIHGWGHVRSSNTNLIHPSLIKINRKALMSEFDFSSFNPQHRPYTPVEPDPPSEEIDPRYGVQKRLVPTGPNPLHH